MKGRMGDWKNGREQGVIKQSNRGASDRLQSNVFLEESLVAIPFAKVQSNLIPSFFTHRAKAPPS
jgi:hypothetical protein